VRPAWQRAALAALLAISAAAARATDVPRLAGRVVDLAELLPPGAESAITEQLATLERDTGAQVVVLTVPTLGGEPLEDYTVAVAQGWRLGRRGVDDGVLLLVARAEHAIRLEVGYGLEAKLPDITCKRIVDELMVPRFRADDFAGGVAAGVGAVERAVRGGEALPAASRWGRGGEALGPLAPSGRLLVGILFLLFMTPFALAALAASGSAGWMLYLFLTPFFAIFPFATFGTPGLAVPLLWLAGFPIARPWFLRWQRRLGRRMPGPTRRTAGRRGGWWGPGGGWGGGLGGGGFGGGSFGGGGAFSGGGGSFGGGGASGRW
jgi:uncharacterized protein